VLAGTDPSTGESSFVVRLAPQLAGLPPGKGGASHGIFLVDTSLSEHPDQFAVNRQILQGILASSPGLSQFNVLTFDTGARWVNQGWITNDAAGRAQALAAIDGILLEGSTDVARALDTLAHPSWDPGGAKDLDAFLLSDGVLDWGDTNLDALITRYDATSPFATRFFAYRTGLAAENLELFQSLTRRGAIFNCLSAADIPTCSTAHQASGMVLGSVAIEPVGPAGASATNLLVAGRQATVIPGATVTIAGKLTTPGPANVRLSGVAPGGDPVEVLIPVDLQPGGELAPRAWGEIAVTQLAATHDPNLEGVAMALSQHFGIASRVGSFLMLEDESQYQKYDVTDETAKFKGQSVKDIVEAALVNLGLGWTSWNQLERLFSDYDDSSHLLEVDGGKLVSTLVSLSTADDLLLPSSSLVVPAITKSEASPSYVAAMIHDPSVVSPFIAEAESRREAGDIGGAVRALSSLVENDPGNAVTERLVGYRIGSWGEAAAADALFLHVLSRRPFEAQSYRDLGNSLWLDRPALTTMMFEAVLAGSWDAKYLGLKTVASEEYGIFVRALTRTSPDSPLTGYVASRAKALALPAPTGDLRVTLTWNTDNTDIDLWVIDPSGEKCFYDHKQLSSGGALLEDITQGYGPERFAAEKAIPGKYQVFVDYYGNNGITLTPETFVNVVVMTRLGTPDEQVMRSNVSLAKVKDNLKVAEIEF
jgi:hypothetical protein